MSNNKMATKADLQEMYQRILPYLGGMPEVLANKFSKGDMYSTDEKMIGQWVDGKPLYQRCFRTSEAYTITNSWTDILNTGLTNFYPISCKVIDDQSGLYESNFKVYIGYTGQYAGIVQAQAITTTSIPLPLGTVIIIQYTKTTDSPISIGNDTDYSTDEKIIGTWIDGKPLYQRVLNKTISTSNPVGNIPNGSTDLYQGNISISSDIPNIDIGMIDISHSYYLLSSASRGFMGAWYEKDTGDIWFSTLYERTNVSATFTINYTKTS